MLMTQKSIELIGIHLEKTLVIKSGAKKILKLKIYLLFLFLTPFIVSAENIDVAPLINLEDILPSYDEEIENVFTDEIIAKKEFNQTKSVEYNNPIATLSILNKITAEVEKFSLQLKESYLYAELRIYVIDCYNSKPYEKKETAAYLNIYNHNTNNKIFNGWMIKSLPSVSSLEHPIYDIWVDECVKL